MSNRGIEFTSFDEEFRQRLAQLLGVLGISQNEFARGMGASSAFVSNMARGLKKPGMEFLTRVAMQYGVSLDWLALGHGSMFGESLVNIDLLTSVQMRVALACRAEVLQDEDAKALIDELLGGSDAATLPRGASHELNVFLAASKGACQKFCVQRSVKNSQRSALVNRSPNRMAN